MIKNKICKISILYFIKLLTVNPWTEDRVGVKPQIEGDRPPFDTFVPKVLPECEYRPIVRNALKGPMESSDKHQKGTNQKNL